MTYLNNNELKELMNGENLVSITKLGLLGWLEHVFSIRITLSELNYQIEEVNRREPLRKRWLQDVEAD